jgi:hypothetical protein
MNAVAARRAGGLFALGLVVRVAAWWAAGWSSLHAPDYQGDAGAWARFARGPGADPEWALPFRPPAMAWLTDLCSDGEDFVVLRLVLVVLGALVAPLLYLALRSWAHERTAVTAGAITAVSATLVQLGNGVHVEVPYLFLATLALLDAERLRRGAGAATAVRFGLVSAAATLFRTEHLVFVVLVLGWLAAVRTWRLAALVLLVCVAALAPWQWHAADLVARANTGGFPGQPPPRLPLPGALPWAPEALAAVEAMPAFARWATFQFVTDTMRARGARRVGEGDLSVLDEAYGSRPEPLATPLLVLYGPLNFFLANSPESDGGFTRAPLDRMPPLAGGPSRYPPGLEQVLPRGGVLVFGYPPHLEAVNHGYRLGLAWIAAHPVDALVLVGKKLAQSFRGAATGLGHANLPFGRDGVRAPVDLTVPDGIAAVVWRSSLLVLAIVGLVRLVRRGPRTAVAPWLIWLVARVVAVVLFFGYARLGALCVPVFALLWATALEPVLLRMRAPGRTLVVVALLLVAADVFVAARTSGADLVAEDGRPAAADSFDRVRVVHR